MSWISGRMSRWKEGEVNELAVSFVPFPSFTLAGDVCLGASGRCGRAVCWVGAVDLLLVDGSEARAVERVRVLLALGVLPLLGPAGRRMWDASASRDLRGVSTDADQEQAFRVYTDPSFVAETARWAGNLAQDGARLAADLRAGKVTAPTIVVSAGERSPRSAIRRAHQRLVSWIPNAELQIWDQTTHPLHIQQPDRVADASRTIATRDQAL